MGGLKMNLKKYSKMKQTQKQKILFDPIMDSTSSLIRYWWFKNL